MTAITRPYADPSGLIELTRVLFRFPFEVAIRTSKSILRTYDTVTSRGNGYYITQEERDEVTEGQISSLRGLARFNREGEVKA